MRRALRALLARCAAAQTSDRGSQQELRTWLCLHRPLNNLRVFSREGQCVYGAGNGSRCAMRRELRRELMAAPAPAARGRLDPFVASHDDEREGGMGAEEGEDEAANGDEDEDEGARAEGLLVEVVVAVLLQEPILGRLRAAHERDARGSAAAAEARAHAAAAMGGEASLAELLKRWPRPDGAQAVPGTATAEAVAAATGPGHRQEVAEAAELLRRGCLEEVTSEPGGVEGGSGVRGGVGGGSEHASRIAGGAAARVAHRAHRSRRQSHARSAARACRRRRALAHAAVRTRARAGEGLLRRVRVSAGRGGRAAQAAGQGGSARRARQADRGNAAA